jgi:hypothetical protein
LAVGFHLGITATQALHDLIDHELGVASNVEVSDPELDGNSQPYNERLVFGDVIWRRKMKPNDVTHVNPEGRDEEQTRACSCFHQRPIEVHGPELSLKLCRGELGVGPLGQEVR